jgi:hypothetical protein
MTLRLAIGPPMPASAVADLAPAGLSAPHPVYTASAQHVIDGGVLAAAQLTGWRSIVSKDGQPVAALESDGSVHQGPFVAGTVDAARVAEERFGGDARDFELRLLRIPAAYTVALWLHAPDDDVLIPLAPAPPSLRPNQPVSEAEFTAALQPLAQARLTSPDRTSSS